MIASDCLPHCMQEREAEREGGGDDVRWPRDRFTARDESRGKSRDALAARDSSRSMRPPTAERNGEPGGAWDGAWGGARYGARSAQHGAEATRAAATARTAATAARAATATEAALIASLITEVSFLDRCLIALIAA